MDGAHPIGDRQRRSIAGKRVTADGNLDREAGKDGDGKGGSDDTPRDGHRRAGPETGFGIELGIGPCETAGGREVHDGKRTLGEVFGHAVERAVDDKTRCGGPERGSGFTDGALVVSTLR